MQMFILILSSLAIVSSVSAAPTHTSHQTQDTVVRYSSLPSQVPANPRSENIDLVHALELAPLAKQRTALLNHSGDFKFDFLNPHPDAIAEGDGGHLVVPNSFIFQALIGNSAMMSMGFIKPCGFNTPHSHPRATEIQVVVKGQLGSEMITENSVGPIQNLLSLYQMTVYPQGAMHLQYNPTCEGSVFVSAFNFEDPGVQQAAQTFFGLRSDALQASLAVEAINGDDIETFAHPIPSNIAVGIAACLAHCGLSNKTG
ncbi:RmlC-like cupin domain-containing protein [Xylariaceae sp. FL0255]|nr:RmlC-like cupin domain-containing protein [Xylariaceae sp. FL0255]